MTHEIFLPTETGIGSNIASSNLDRCSEYILFRKVIRCYESTDVSVIWKVFNISSDHEYKMRKDKCFEMFFAKLDKLRKPSILHILILFNNNEPLRAIQECLTLKK